MPARPSGMNDTESSVPSNCFHSISIGSVSPSPDAVQTRRRTRARAAMARSTAGRDRHCPSRASASKKKGRSPGRIRKWHRCGIASEHRLPKRRVHCLPHFQPLLLLYGGNIRGRHARILRSTLNADAAPLAASAMEGFHISRSRDLAHD